jgi:hypothetical protein
VAITSSSLLGETIKDASRSFRNKNPGNLKWAGQAKAIGHDDKGFAIFATTQDGMDALMPYTQEELDLANDHLLQLEEMVAKQSARIEELRRAGFPTDRAQHLLILLMELRQQITLQRDELAKALTASPARDGSEP